MGGYQVENQIIIQVRLVLEELLLVLMNGISGGEDLKLTLMKRARRLWIKIDYKGRRFDPTNRDVLDNFSQSFLDMLRIKPVWKYQRGVNRITISIPYIHPHTEHAFLITILLASAVGALGSFIPEEIRSLCSTYLLSPVTDLFMKYLNVLHLLLYFWALFSTLRKTEAKNLKSSESML